MMKMKQSIKFFLAALAVLAVPSAVEAQMLSNTKVNVTRSSAKKQGNNVRLEMDLDLSNMFLSENRGIIFTPMFVNAEDTVKLPAAEIMGKARYVYFLRRHKAATESPAVVVKRNNGKPQVVHYSCAVPFENWMSQSQLIMGEGLCGCDQTLLSSNPFQSLRGVNLRPDEWNYQFAYVQPSDEDVKMRMASGTARLDFPIGSSTIIPDFGKNASELMKIRHTIEPINDDPDIKVTKIILHGFASPDGGYAVNLRLSHKRTAALSNWLINEYHFPTDALQVDWTAEDWQSIREYVENNSVPYQSRILAVIDNGLKPDSKEAYLKKHFPLFHRTLMNSVYPGLRRVDYTVDYNVRNFDLQEAREIVKTRPNKLSLIEMYKVAQSYEPGSQDFKQVFDIAVRMYPNSPLANLNAANASLSRGDTISAKTFLMKAGDGPEVENARGVLEVKKGDYSQALNDFKEAADAGLEAGKFNLQELSKKQQ